MADKRYTFRGKAVPLFRIGGTPVAEYSEKVEKPTQSEIIAIEGDGIVLKNKKKGGVSEVHRLQIYEEIA